MSPATTTRLANDLENVLDRTESKYVERSSYAMARRPYPILGTCTDSRVTVYEWTMSARNKDITILVTRAWRTVRHHALRTMLNIVTGNDKLAELVEPCFPRSV